MFNFQGSELIIIMLLALVVLGPEKLPEAMRRLGRFYADLKKMSTGFQEEFRAAVDEPIRELRDTANTVRDSVDFRKLADGERDEKPKSAEMAPADPGVQPTQDVPFRPVSGRPTDDVDDVAPSAATEPSTEPSTEGSTETSTEPSTDGSTETSSGTSTEPSTDASTRPDRPPTSPEPFSSSQTISAAPRPADDADPARDPMTPLAGVDELGGHAARPADVAGMSAQIAVDDEHGLREARPADVAREPTPGTPAQVAVDDEHGLREARPAEDGAA